jgi:IMP dehydrogenase
MAIRRLVGILTNRDVRFATDPGQSGRPDDPQCCHGSDGTATDEARRLLHEHRIEKLVVVDAGDNCIGLITVKDMEKAQNHPLASKDERGGCWWRRQPVQGLMAFKRAEALIEAGADVIVVDTAHGHSEGVLEAVSAVRKIANQDTDHWRQCGHG